MKITPSTIYWITRLDDICGFFIAATIILSLVLFFLLFVNLVMKIEGYDDGQFQECVKLARKSSLVLLIAIAGLLLTPNTKELAAMIVIPKIAHSETVQGLGKEIVELAHEWIRELKPKAERKRNEKPRQIQDGRRAHQGVQ